MSDESKSMEERSFEAYRSTTEKLVTMQRTQIETMMKTCADLTSQYNELLRKHFELMGELESAIKTAAPFKNKA